MGISRNSKAAVRTPDSHAADLTGNLSDNKAANLTGNLVDNKAANLTGNAVVDAETSVVGSSSGGSINNNLRPRQNFITGGQIMASANVNVAAGEKVVCTYFFISGYDNNNQTGAMNHQLQRDTNTILANWGHGDHTNSPIKMSNDYVDDPGAGNFNYRVQQTVNSDLGDIQSAILRVKVIKVTDNHAAVLTGNVVDNHAAALTGSVVDNHAASLSGAPADIKSVGVSRN